VGDDILTKAEIMAMLEVQKEAATQMEKVASTLHSISKNQEALLNSLAELEKAFRNGLCDKVVEKVNKEMGVVVQPFSTGQKQLLDKVTVVKDNTTWLKHIIGASTLIIIIVTVIVKVLNTQPSTDAMIRIIHNEMQNYHNNLDYKKV